MGSTFGTISRKSARARTPSRSDTGVASYTLGANIENLTHTSATAFAGTGNALDNVITGGGGSNTLTGLGGNDRLISTGGLDILVGGKGDDVYIEDTTKCTITELAGEGTDTLATVRQNITNDALADNVENLIYIGSGGNIHAIGNNLNNIIAGGADGDILDGLGGSDTLFGGLGDDQFRFADGGGHDVVQDFAGQTIGGGDVIQIDGANVNNFADVMAGSAQQENGVLIHLDGDTTILLLGYAKADLVAGDFFFI